MSLRTPSLTDFLNITKGFQRPWRYYLLFEFPSGLLKDIGAGSDFQQLIPALASKVELPGREFETIEWKHQGKTINMPVYAKWPSVQITFLCDQEMKIKRMLDAWQNYVIDPNSYYVNYYEKYANQNCTVASLDASGLPSYVIRINEFWPRRVDSIVMSSEGGQSVATVEAEFVMKDWQNTDSLKMLPNIKSDDDVFSRLRLNPKEYINKLAENITDKKEKENILQLNETINKRLMSDFNHLKGFAIDPMTIINSITDLIAGKSVTQI